MNLTLSIVALLIISQTSHTKVNSINSAERIWSKEKAWNWYERVEPICGCNYLPRTAVNSTEMWQADTFDPETIDQELDWAKNAGYNSVRVFLQYLVWQNEPEDMKKRMDEFLSIAYKHGIRTMFVTFGDCSFSGREPYLGKQEEPVPGVHNSQWVPSPGLKRVTKRSTWHELEIYIKDIVGYFGEDERVLIWDLYNEPGNSGMGEKSLPLAEASFRWARDVNPSQPLTIGAWTDFESQMSKRLMELSDVVSFHSYDEPVGVKAKVKLCQTYKSPIICTEFLRRQVGNTFEAILPVFVKHRVVWYNWGLVAGRIQTYMPWGSKEGDQMPQVWQHDVFHSNGEPYNPEEIEILKSYANKIPFPKSLDSANISVDRLDSILENALILGNGDINALLYSENGDIILRITKNDVWDARLDTQNDPNLPTLARVKELVNSDFQDRNWILPEGSDWQGPDSYHAYPYPCPRTCVSVRIGNLSKKRYWRQIRAQGDYNAWKSQGDAAVMRIRGRKGTSNGYSYGPLNISTDDYSHLRVRLSGSENARFYIDIMGNNDAIIFGSQWIYSPTKSEEKVFELPSGKTASRIILYTWTEDGNTAENRFELLSFEGKAGTVPVDLNVETPPTCPGELDIRRAVASVERNKDGLSKTEIRALSQRNVFLIESAAPVQLNPIISNEIPVPIQVESDKVTWLHQTIPGGLDWPGMDFAVALASKGEKKAVAIVTSRESKDEIKDAVYLASSTLEEESSKLIGCHEAEWNRFWSVSGIEIDDELLSEEWYRNLYFLRCVTKPGVISPGLFAGLINNQPAWHGDYHTNYNIQQTFWTSYITNHPELAEPYDRLISDYLPRARWLANQIFDYDGAYYPHVLFAYEPPNPEHCLSKNRRQYIHHVWGFTIGVSGFAVQPLWLHYKYKPDYEYLEKTAYPAIRDVAIFYANFIENCQIDEKGKVILAPSVSPEHWGWTPNFKRNRNCTFDIAMIEYILKAAIEGAKELNRDAELIESFQKSLRLLPEYPTTKEDKPVVVDVEDAPPITYNIAIPAVPVFPGDAITCWSTEEEKKLFMRSIENLKWNGNNSTIILAVARARLNIPDTLEWLQDEVKARLRPNGTLTLNRRGHGINTYGHYTEQFAVSMAISELLLQSVDDVVRVFPALPKDKSASFENLRVQGGFLVSSRQKDGKIEYISINAPVGGKLKLFSPWTQVSVLREDNDSPFKLYPDERGIIELDTISGENIIIKKD